MVPYELREGTVFAGDYRVVQPLARGGMGAVYVAEQLSTGKRRALKVMSPMLAEYAKARERFVQEAKVGALIDSVHVVEVIAAGIDDATQMPWLAMELLQGETLQERMERLGSIPAAELKEIASQLRHALALAHAQGIVHRDLKPENLFLENPRRAGVPFTVKILDFGIAKLVQQAKGRQASGTQALGSPLWMAPEQANAHTISPATDVWALGLVAFAAITGRVYWRTAATDGDLHLTRLLVEILVDPLVPASHRAEELHARIVPGSAFDRWLDRCLTREAPGRFADAGQCLDALVEVLEGGDFVDTGRDFEPLPTAATAMAEGLVVDPNSATAPVAPEVYEPIVRGEARPEPPPRAGSSGMGMGQIAALIAGSVLIACMALFSGIMSFAVLSGEDDASPSAAGPDPSVAPVSPDSVHDQGGGQTKTSPMRPLVPPVAHPTPTTSTPDTPGQPGGDVFAPNVRPTQTPQPVARTAAGRALYRGTIEPCWRAELEHTRHGPTRLSVDITVGAAGTGLSNIRLPGRWHGSPFAHCVIGRLPYTRFEAPPSDTHIVLDLPGAR